MFQWIHFIFMCVFHWSSAFQALIYFGAWMYGILVIFALFWNIQMEHNWKEMVCACLQGNKPAPLHQIPRKGHPASNDMPLDAFKYWSNCIFSFWLISDSKTAVSSPPFLLHMHALKSVTPTHREYTHTPLEPVPFLRGDWMCHSLPTSLAINIYKQTSVAH